MHQEPFKSRCTEKYDEWLEKTGIRQETECGNLKAPTRKGIVTESDIEDAYYACQVIDADDTIEDNIDIEYCISYYVPFVYITLCTS